MNHGSIHYRARSRNLVSPYHRAFVYLLCYFGGGVDTLEVCFGHLYRDELRVLPVRVVDQNLLHRRTCCLLPFRRLWTGVSGDICHHIWMFPCLPGVHGKRKEEDRNSNCKAKVSTMQFDIVFIISTVKSHFQTTNIQPFDTIGDTILEKYHDRGKNVFEQFRNQNRDEARHCIIRF